MTCPGELEYQNMYKRANGLAQLNIRPKLYPWLDKDSKWRIRRDQDQGNLPKLMLEHVHPWFQILFFPPSKMLNISSISKSKSFIWMILSFKSANTRECDTYLILMISIAHLAFIYQHRSKNKDFMMNHLFKLLLWVIKCLKGIFFRIRFGRWIFHFWHTGAYMVFRHSTHTLRRLFWHDMQLKLCVDSPDWKSINISAFLIVTFNTLNDCIFEWLDIKMCIFIRIR